MNPLRLVTTDEKKQQRLVDSLRELLKQAEAGEITGICGIVELPGDNYRNIGSETCSRLQTAGALLDAAINRLAP